MDRVIQYVVCIVVCWRRVIQYVCAIVVCCGSGNSMWCVIVVCYSCYVVGRVIQCGVL